LSIERREPQACSGPFLKANFTDRVHADRSKSGKPLHITCFPMLFVGSGSRRCRIRNERCRTPVKLSTRSGCMYVVCHTGGVASFARRDSEIFVARDGTGILKNERGMRARLILSNLVDLLDRIQIRLFFSFGVTGDAGRRLTCQLPFLARWGKLVSFV